MDGTLLNSEKKVSERCINVIKKLNKAGIPVIIATARPPRSVNVLLPEEIIQSSAAMVYYNGAMISSERLGINHHFPIESTLSTEIIEYLIETETNLWLSIEVEDEWYSYMDLDYRTTMKIESNPEKIDLELLKRMNPTKILVSNYRSLESLNKKFEQRVNITHTDANQLTQIMKLNSSKEYAVSLIAKKLGIKLKQVMVFGDDFNDLELFKLCGYPIAMGNAIEELKVMAKEITESNDNDGVAITLESLFI